MPTIERVRAGEQPHGLELAEHALTSAREPDPRARHDQPEQRDGLQRLARREQRAVVERRAGPRVEQVDRHLARRQRRELEGEVDALLERLAHAQDPAAAQLHADFAGQASGGDAVVPRVRRADRGEDLPARLEVVVVAAHAGRREPFRLLARQQPE